jgi:hypothetical protein
MVKNTRYRFVRLKKYECYLVRLVKKTQRLLDYFKHLLDNIKKTVTHNKKVCIFTLVQLELKKARESIIFLPKY